MGKEILSPFCNRSLQFYFCSPLCKFANLKYIYCRNTCNFKICFLLFFFFKEFFSLLKKVIFACLCATILNPVSTCCLANIPHNSSSKPKDSSMIYRVSHGQNFIWSKKLPYLVYWCKLRTRRGVNFCT